MPNPITLPAGTTLGRSFEYGLDVNLGTFASPTWQSCRRISGWAPTFPKISEDVTSYDNLGEDDEDIVARGFAGAFDIQANRSITTGLYLPEVEAILAAAKAIADGAVLDIRFYHKPATGTPHPTDAGRASVTVEASRANTDSKGIEKISVALAGKGAYTPIANPFTGYTPATPKITSILPAGRGAGGMITITGTGFLGATDVKFAAVSAAAFVVANDSTIYATLPAGSAGPVNITVITPAGTSPAVAYTRVV